MSLIHIWIKKYFNNFHLKISLEQFILYWELQPVHVVNYTVFFIINLCATESGKITKIEDLFIVFCTNFSRLWRNFCIVMGGQILNTKKSVSFLSLKLCTNKNQYSKNSNESTEYSAVNILLMIIKLVP